MGRWIVKDDPRIIEYIGYAGDAFGDEDYEEAVNYANEILRINPYNPVAVAVLELSNGYMEVVDADVFAGICDKLVEVMNDIFDTCGQGEAAYDFCDTWIRRLGDLAAEYIGQIESFEDEEDYGYYLDMLPSIVDSSCKVYFECTQLISDPTEIQTDLYEYMLGIAEAGKNVSPGRIVEKVIEACNNRIFIRQRSNGERDLQQIADKWSENKEEAEAVLNEAEAILAKYDEITAEINNLDEKEGAEKRKTQAEIDELKRQKSRLGLFKGKEKRVLDAQIKTKTFELESIEHKYAERRRSLEKAQRQVNEKIEFYTNKMLNKK